MGSIVSDQLRTTNIFSDHHCYDMVAKSIGDDTNYKQLLILPFDN